MLHYIPSRHCENLKPPFKVQSSQATKSQNLRKYQGRLIGSKSSLDSGKSSLEQDLQDSHSFSHQNCKHHHVSDSDSSGESNSYHLWQAASLRNLFFTETEVFLLRSIPIIVTQTDLQLQTRVTDWSVLLLISSYILNSYRRRLSPQNGWGVLVPSCRVQALQLWRSYFSFYQIRRYLTKSFFLNNENKSRLYVRIPSKSQATLSALIKSNH